MYLMTTKLITLHLCAIRLDRNVKQLNAALPKEKYLQVVTTM